jgi:hypothetical protein
MIGPILKDRLYSLRSCHAILERTVVKPCHADDVGKAITEAIQEIMLAEGEGRKAFTAEDIKVIVEFRL